MRSQTRLTDATALATWRHDYPCCPAPDIKIALSAPQTDHTNDL